MNKITDFIGKWKIQLIAGIAGLAVLAIALGATYQIAYNKGLNVSEVAISEYRAEVADLQQQVTRAQGRVTERIVTEYVPRVVERTRVEYVNRDIIREVVPEQFVFSNGWIYTYNQSIQGLEIDPALAGDDTPSNVTDVEGLDTINQNNSIALRTRDQLLSLQQWNRDIIDETNNLNQ